jgi:hypothetical protein
MGTGRGKSTRPKRHQRRRHRRLLMRASRGERLRQSRGCERRGAGAPHGAPSRAEARSRHKQRTLNGMSGCVAPLLLHWLHNFPDPGRFHRFPCSSPPSDIFSKVLRDGGKNIYQRRSLCGARRPDLGCACVQAPGNWPPYPEDVSTSTPWYLSTIEGTIPLWRLTSRIPRRNASRPRSLH